jgi:glutamine cyclotransferase
MEAAQTLYYEGCKQSTKYTSSEVATSFYETCNEASRECIKKFIEASDLDTDKLTQYLITSQDNKKYLLYKNGEFNIESSNIDDYIIISCSKNPERARYEAITKSGKKIYILLRWKNGNGIAYPAFQIS